MSSNATTLEDAENRLFRLKQIIPTIFPIIRSGWWKGVKEGRFPQPVKLGPRTTAWRASDIQKLIDNT